jgi:molybdopterin converting factor small subunit
MSDPAGRIVSGVGHVTVRYWAAARAAAGVDAEPVPVEEGATLADVLAEVRSRHGARSRLTEVLAVCSVLVGDRPVGSRAPEDVRLAAGDTVELLPPFAGG